MVRQSGSKEGIIWLGKADASSNVMTARTNGRNRMEPEGQRDARNATARIFAGRHLTEDTRKEAEEQVDAGDGDATNTAKVVVEAGLEVRE